MRLIFNSLLIVGAMLLLSFKSINKYSDEYIYVYVNGQAIDFWSNKPIKKQSIYINESEIGINSLGWDYSDNSKTNRKGEFIIEGFFKKPINSIWISTKDHAEIKLTSKSGFKDNDTINLKEITFVSYNNEYKIDKTYNILNRMRSKTLRSKYFPESIKKIDSIFNNSNGNKKNICLNSIDSLEIMTRYNFGNDKKEKKTIRGTIISSRKIITFLKNIDNCIIRKL